MYILFRKNRIWVRKWRRSIGGKVMDVLIEGVFLRLLEQLDPA